MEKIIEKIRKLLAMTEENGCSENEAMIAALKAQKLMAEYNLSIADVDTETSKQTIKEHEFYCGKGDKWKYRLASVIARNFCCKTYFLNKTTIVFYGYEKDAKIATDVFKFLFNTGNKLADKCYYEYYKNGKNTRGVKNAYLAGFVKGIDEILGKQCTALMIVVPKEVSESYDKMTEGWSPINSSLRISNDGRAYEQGRTDGRNTANSRSIEA